MKINILMIDDNINLIEMVREYFKENEEVNITYEAHDGEEGINKIIKNEKNIDLIILDLIMPNKDGIYVLNEMKKRGINKKVIVATSYNAAEVIREVSEFGVSYYILKPFDLSDLEKRIYEITKKEREKLIKTIKSFNVEIEGFRPIEEAIITSGGINTKEINPKTMESKKVKGLYFAGEIIDVDAYTGGFNLQIAYSTGYVAGMLGHVKKFQ